MGSAVLVLLILASLRYGSASLVITPDESELVLQTGESKELSCSGNGPTKWNATRTQKRRLQGKTLMKIVDAKYTDTGTYSCIYEGTSSTESKTIHVFVKDSTRFWHTLKTRVSAEEGADAVLECLLTDPSVPSSDIFLKSEVARDTSFDAKKGFTIHNVQMADEGIHVCVATVNGVQRKSEEITLVVMEVAKEPPTVTMTPGKYFRIEGEVFQIVCTIFHPIEVNSIEWEHNKKNVTGNSSKKVNWISNKYVFDSTLRVPNLSLNNSGEYSCIGQNRGGSTRISVYLEVLEKPFINITTVEPTKVSLHAGTDQQWTVYIEAYPDISSWSWLHETSNGIRNVSSQADLQPNGRYRNVSTLDLLRIKYSEAGIYTFYASNSMTNASFSFEIIVYKPPTVEISPVTEFNSTYSMSCVATGIPRPTFQWFQCPGTSCSDGMKQPLRGEVTSTLDEDVVESHLILNSISNGTILCEAYNIAGNGSAQNSIVGTVLRVTSKEEHHLFNPLLISMASVGGFLLLLSFFLFYKYQQKPKYEVRWQIVRMSEDNQYMCIDPTQLPYNDKWEFPRTNLQFGKTLGAGAFGQVMEAQAFGMGKDDSALRVAVKMLKSSAHTDEVEALMSELKILSHLGNHQNIVNLLGACTQGGPILVITEYCHHGDLLNFLRKKSEVLNSMCIPCLADTSAVYKNISVEQKYMGSDSGVWSFGNSGYVDMKPVINKESSKGSSLEEEVDDMDDLLPLDLHDLLHFSLQVAQGMSFLASKNCIHRDLAARNVLIAQGRVAKICDFGLARDIENDTNYVVKGNARLPVKWMAPESIFDCIYTVQSDVWSYGILLWEIFSLGRSPYPGVIVNRKFYKMIKEGYQMDVPDSAPYEICRLMKACWDLEPTQRPTFTQITDLINRQMSIITNKEPDDESGFCSWRVVRSAVFVIELSAWLWQCCPSDPGPRMRGGKNGETMEASNLVMGMLEGKAACSSTSVSRVDQKSSMLTSLVVRNSGHVNC